MAHAKTFNEFVPSIVEAKQYEKEWKQTLEYENYQRINIAFQNQAMDEQTLKQKCFELRRSYRMILAGVSYDQAVARIQQVDPNALRVQQGDHDVVDELKMINNRRMYVFATMYCHHSNPQKYYGFSNEIARILFKLNNRDHFYPTFTYDYLRYYPNFDNVMHTLVVKYNLETLTNTLVDVMLRMACERYGL